ncbi:hypothetical protein Rsub_03839 [Raphidocelis subcapitata]|uniref:Uncharacterized protein n=1 Tax=Raphidocelis subcapitata TaxID=307507 RepID=A0A2V0NTM3_9CHLO|nr:hypothetical protein Rsub_03839 [Raphidocelis subcapitata]|eukprot:GBF90984.1 hypothetical protein Rsub_03839 [Raphidocelis subcapitata]
MRPAGAEEPAPSTSAPPRPSPRQKQQQQQHQQGEEEEEEKDAPPSLLAWARSAAWRAWLAVDCAVAWLTGLDESRYQWAIDRYHQQQAEARARPGLLLALRARVLDGGLSSTAPHVAPPSNMMVADAENPRAPA